MKNTTPNDSEKLSGLTARIKDTVQSSSFDQYVAFELIEEACGGSLASREGKAPMVTFNREALEDLRELVNRLNMNIDPATIKDDQDMDLYTEMIDTAENLISARDAQLKATESPAEQQRLQEQQAARDLRVREAVIQAQRGNVWNTMGDKKRKAS